MEGGVGGGVLGAAQEPRAAAEEGKAGVGEGRGGGGGGMKFSVWARAPHGVGALLLIGGAALVGAAVVAWRHAHRRGGKDRAENRQHDRLPAKDEVLDGGVVEDGKDSVWAARETDLSDENLRGEKTEIGPHGLDGVVLEEIQQIHGDTEIVTDEPDSEHVEEFDDNSKKWNPTEASMQDVDNEHVEKFDPNSSIKPAEITTHNMFQDNEHVEKFDLNSSTKPAKFTTHDMDNEHVEKFDQNSSTKPAEITAHDMDSANMEMGDESSTKNDTENENLSNNDIENVNSSMNGNKKDIAPNDNKDAVTSDQSTLCISSPGITLHKHSDHNDGAQEAESMENTPTAQLMMHQEQLLDEMMTDAVRETALAKLAEGKIIDKSEVQLEEKKALVELIELVSSQALSSLVKPIEKKEPELPGPNETGMKMEQDRTATNGELKEHDMSKTGAMPGGVVVTMDRRSVSMAIVALMFALTIGITIIVHLYAPPRATKLQMDLQ